MSSLYEKYAGLEQKIARMTEKTWDTNRELADIDKSIHERFDKKSGKEGSQVNRKQSGYDQTQNLLSKKLLTP